MEPSESRAKAEQKFTSLAVKLGERDALPVRAIPYVTGWAISPSEVAKNFARKSAASFERLENTDTYHLADDRPVKLLPKEWDKYVATLKGLEGGLKEKHPKHEQGYAAWLSQSVAKLPAGVFVWLDEFVADFKLDFGPDRLSIMGEREGDRELNLSPFLEGELLNMVMEGFELRTPLPDIDSSVDTIADLFEYVYNGRQIDWRYWVQSMPTLSPSEACRLMNGLDPELFEDLNSRPVSENNPSQACAEARRMERLAIAQTHEKQTPTEWYRWALEHNFSVHRGFFIAANGRHLRENEALVLSRMPRAEACRWERARIIGNDLKLVSMDFSRYADEMSMTFPDFVAEVDERLARWRLGRFEIEEAAKVLADSAGMDEPRLYEQMVAAIRTEKLTFRVNTIRVDQQHIPQKRLWCSIVFKEDVNAWLKAEAIGDELRLEYPYPDSLKAGEWLRAQWEQDPGERRTLEKARAAEQAATGWYFLFEAADDITRQRGINMFYSDRLLKSMIGAAERGALLIFDEVHRTKLAKGEEVHSRRITRREHVNVWLATDGAGYLWADESNTKPEQRRQGAVTVQSATDTAEQQTPKIPVTSPTFSMPKSVLVEKHKHHWPTINGDLKAASTNNLKKAKAGQRGWHENIALEWAKTNGKLTDEAPQANELSNTMRNWGATLPSKTHTLED